MWGVDNIKNRPFFDPFSTLFTWLEYDWIKHVAADLAAFLLQHLDFILNFVFSKLPGDPTMLTAVQTAGSQCRKGGVQKVAVGDRRPPDLFPAVLFQCFPGQPLDQILQFILVFPLIFI